MKRQGRGKNRIILGLTGSFGSGKTTVAEMFQSFGAAVIDADRIAHKIIQLQSPIYKKIMHTFGKGILKKNKAIDRDKLSRVVFSNKKLLKILNKMTHPEIIRVIKERIEKTRARVIVLDAPLLIEAGLKKIVDSLIVVTINRDIQIQRIKDKTSLSEAEILSRINCQIPLKEKVRLADFIIDNTGSIGETRKQVKKIWESLNLPHTQN